MSSLARHLGSESAAPGSDALASLERFTGTESALLAGFGSVGPELLESRHLMRRTDSKFMLPRSRLLELLAPVQGDYGILLAGQSHSAHYLTEYLDTRRFMFFHDHRRGRRVRYKVRRRHYLDRQLSYIEIKGKGAAGTTQKWRREVPFMTHELTAEDRAFISSRSPVDGLALVPALTNTFRRITLVGLALPERVTIDMDLEFCHARSTERLEGVLIVEVKQPRLLRTSPIVRSLTRLHTRPGSASKYCVGMMLLHPQIESNRLRPTLLQLERLGRAA